MHNLSNKLVLGTVQFGMDYGIANVSGQPSRKEVFNILDLAWEKGVNKFDTAPGYGSESLLGEFISTNGIQDQIKVLTKIPSLEGLSDYKTVIRASIESSLKNLGCPIDVLFFHNPADSILLLEDPRFFESVLQNYSIASLGLSVYEPQEIEKLTNSSFDLAHQFPFNVLDRRFENVSMPKGKRYARSVFLQGLLAFRNGLRPDAPKELHNLQKEYHKLLKDKRFNPVSFATSFVVSSDLVDFFLVGVDSKKQLQDILGVEQYVNIDMSFMDTPLVKTAPKWLDPREWN